MRKFNWCKLVVLVLLVCRAFEYGEAFLIWKHNPTMALFSYLGLWLHTVVAAWVFITWKQALPYFSQDLAKGR